MYTSAAAPSIWTQSNTTMNQPSVDQPLQPPSVLNVLSVLIAGPLLKLVVWWSSRCTASASKPNQLKNINTNRPTPPTPAISSPARRRLMRRRPRAR
jgi:hypothetical protein